ncbi:uncharacterized protein LOC129267819 [Lytechinus pictus]|uniref:uncharacterized protein LOC129267819 n=1 Tax=Lytechinus pictus TaxID=7653 RepID=UPI0030B9D00A
MSKDECKLLTNKLLHRSSSFCWLKPAPTNDFLIILRITSFNTSSPCLDLTLSVSVAKTAKSVPAGVESAASRENAVRKEMELAVESVQMLRVSVPMAVNVKEAVPVLWGTVRARSSRPCSFR